MAAAVLAIKLEVAKSEIAVPAGERSLPGKTYVVLRTSKILRKTIRHLSFVVRPQPQPNWPFSLSASALAKVC